MKKENKQRKREAEQEAEREERDRRFKRQGNICLAVIAACFVLMLVVGRLNAGAAWLGNFFLVMGIVIAVAFFYSLRTAGRRLKELREEDRPR
ncbi:MAG: hypothetical protein ACOX83_05640 [Candidatus Spyradocola sp.]|jgi:uncharacterized ion transporter superfamily protein YfcC